MPDRDAPAEGARPLLVFDGDCAVCTSVARWAERHLGGRADVAPWQRLDLAPLGLTEADVATAMYWVDGTGRTWRGHLGTGRMLQAFGGAWRPLGWLARTPPTSWLAGPLYRLVAANRHRLPGSTPACRLDDPGTHSPGTTRQA